MSLDICCYIQMVGSEFGVKYMKYLYTHTHIYIYIYTITPVFKFGISEKNLGVFKVNNNTICIEK